MSSVYPADAGDLVDLEYECKKFRICIIGRSGVGKSTLLGKVFGFSDEDVRLRHFL
jgi:ABC-type nitrate/sulfonate/bicarbonate transport system ATPase subunit